MANEHKTYAGDAAVMTKNSMATPFACLDSLRFVSGCCHR